MCDTFITMPYILLLLIIRIGNNLRKLTSKLKCSASLKIDNHDYRINSKIEHHGENISRGHYTTTAEYDDKWLHCNDVFIITTQLSPHLTDSYLLFYVQP